MRGAKIFLLIALMCVQARAQSAEAIERTKFVEDSKCLDKEKLALADVLEFVIDDKIEMAEKNPKLKCFASCLLEHAKLLDGCTVVISKKSDNLMDMKRDEFVKLMESCKADVKGTERCECGYQLVKCMNEKDKKA